MRSRKITTIQNKKPTVRRERDPISWKYILLTSFCGLILVIGFFGAARQHFASINYGIENSKLKKQVENLKAEQVRNKLAKAIALSPAEIKVSAKKLGFTEITASNIQSFHTKNISDEKANVNKSSEPQINLSEEKNKEKKVKKIENKEVDEKVKNKK